MKTEFQSPRTVAEIASVFLSLTPMRDPMIRPRLAFWTERFGTKPLAEITPDDIDVALAELETVPGRDGKFKSGPTVNRYRMALQSAIRFAKRKRLLPRGWVSPLQDIPQHKENPGKLRFLTIEESQLAVLRQWISRPDPRT